MLTYAARAALTPALGGSLYQCDDCDALDYRYHSCRNRHCPKCQAERAQTWLERTRSRLLPCDHYLLTFTLPAQLRPVARSNQKLVYAALLREAAAAVQTLADDRQWIGATLGILAVLDTWSRTLEYHPHAHLLINRRIELNTRSCRGYRAARISTSLGHTSQTFRQAHYPYQWSKKTGAIAASAAPTCRTRMGTACLGDRGTHLIAKNNTIGAWAAIRSCQMWAAAPSSAGGAVPCKAMNTNTVARAPRDIATGRKALGCFSMLNGFISPPEAPSGALRDCVKTIHGARSSRPIAPVRIVAALESI